jgi:hypothetical protein
MPLFKKKEEREQSKDEKQKGLNDRKESRRSFRLEKIKEITAKAYAVANKRKWLVFMIVAAIAAYLIIFKGGFDIGGIKSLLGF